MLSKDHNYIYLIYRDGTIQAWDVFNSENIFYFENKNIPINEVVDTFSRNEMCVLGSRGELMYYDLYTGSIFKEVQLGNFPKSRLLKRFKNTLVFVFNGNIYSYCLADELTFYEKQYIRKTFLENGKTNSEKNFISFFENISHYYQSSRFMQIYFNPYFACALFNYQRGL